MFIFLIENEIRDHVSDTFNRRPNAYNGSLNFTKKEKEKIVCVHRIMRCEIVNEIFEIDEGKETCNEKFLK